MILKQYVIVHKGSLKKYYNARRKASYSKKRFYLNKFNKLWVTITSLPEFILLKIIPRSYTPIRESFQNENL